MVKVSFSKREYISLNKRITSLKTNPIKYQRIGTGPGTKTVISLKSRRTGPGTKTVVSFRSNRIGTGPGTKTVISLKSIQTGTGPGTRTVVSFRSNRIGTGPGTKLTGWLSKQNSKIHSESNINECMAYYND